MSIDIETYKPVDKSSKCKRCGSLEVTWHETGNPKHWVLSEIFTLDGEEVYSIKDIHMRYCSDPIRPWHTKEDEPNPLQRHINRQNEINAAVKAFADGDDTPADPEPDSKPEPKTDGHPFCCSVCGSGIVTGMDGLNYDQQQDGDHMIIGAPHTCGNADEIGAARANGTRQGYKLDFKDISRRMDWLQGAMEAHKLAGKPINEESAKWAAEYLILRKRLYTEPLL